MFEQFIGQNRIKKQIELVVHTYKITNKFGHIGIFARPGSGKTMLAQLIAEELNSEFIYLNATAITSPISFAQQIYKAKENSKKHYLFLIDECHMLPRKIQENLLSVLESPAKLCFVSPTKIRGITKNGVSKVVQKGESITIQIPDNVSYIFASTHPGALRDTLLSRLEVLVLDDYTNEDMLKILKTNMHTQLSENVLKSIINISKNIREMKSYLKSFESYIDLHQLQAVTIQDLRNFCKIKCVESDGSGKKEMAYLAALSEHTTISLNTMAAMIQTSTEEITNIIEPFLLVKGYITITARGRELSDNGRGRIGFNKQDIMVID